jgi:Flp pilus assembly protein TadD
MAVDTTHQNLSSQQFLRQTSRPKPGGIPIARNDAKKYEPGIVRDRIYITANPLDNEAIDRIEKWPAFFAMAIHVDVKDANHVASRMHEPLTAILSEMVKNHGGIWFHWKGPLYGYLLPQSDQEKARSTAAEIQHSLGKASQETISIGMANYPLSTFDRTQTLANACKALDHAGFFGPGGTAIFDAVTLNISGDQHYQQGHLHDAMSEYRDALTLDPDNINVHNSLGVCWADLGDHQRAEACFREAMTLSPDEPMAVYNLGMLRLLDEDCPQALVLFKRAYALDTATFQIAFQIGKLLVEQSEFSKARPYLERAIALAPHRHGALCLLGQCLEAEAHHTDAIKIYEKAVKANPNDAKALSALGDLYDHIGENRDICLTFSRQSVTLSPRNGTYRFRLARLYEKYGSWESALDEYDQAAALGYDCQTQAEELSAQLKIRNSPDTKCA